MPEAIELRWSLLNAIQKGDLDAARRALERGADINGKDPAGDTAMFYAGSAPAVKWLTVNGADLNARNSVGRTAWHSVKSLEVLAFLVKLGADLNAQDNSGETPLHSTLDPEYAATLLALGANPAALDNEGRTPAETRSWRRRMVYIEAQIESMDRWSDFDIQQSYTDVSSKTTYRLPADSAEVACHLGLEAPASKRDWATAR